MKNDIIGKLENFKRNFEKISHDTEKGIYDNRTAGFTVRITDKNGLPVSGKTVTVEQISSDFDFGTNVLMLGSMGEREKEYRRTVTDICNLVTTTFCWNDTEYEKGKFRFAEGSPEIYRRPPADRVLSFAAENSLKMKGQPLVADSWYPSWASKNKADLEKEYISFMETVASRYDGKCKIFDVVNESNYCEKRTPSFPLFTGDAFDYVKWAMKTAGSIFSGKTVLERNEGTEVNTGKDAEKYYLQNKTLLSENIRLDAIGHQFHMFSEKDCMDKLFSEDFLPENLYKAYLRMSSLGIPMYISEITVPTVFSGLSEKEGEEVQSDILTILYKLWFSVPNMKGIIYWNMKDGDAWTGEVAGHGCLTDVFLRRKKSYLDLYYLIKKEWNTRFSAKTDQNGVISFRGFKGNYKITVYDGKQITGTATVSLLSDLTADVTTA